MPRDELQPDRPPAADLVLRSPVNWTAVLFAGLLGAMHWGVSIPAFALGRWEGYLSLCLGALFAAVAVGIYCVRAEVQVLKAERVVRTRAVLLATWHQSDLPFARVHGVRLTLLPGGAEEARIEILSVDGDVECPPTKVPRQEALLLAMTIEVPLVRVSEEGAAVEPERPEAERRGRF
ncbi:MAG TPA: hypothetical protein VF796_03890 [Humisphaera sp.]